jgi:hypothetical protein
MINDLKWSSKQTSSTRFLLIFNPDLVDWHSNHHIIVSPNTTYKANKHQAMSETTLFLRLGTSCAYLIFMHQILAKQLGINEKKTEKKKRRDGWGGDRQKQLLTRSCILER